VVALPVVLLLLAALGSFVYGAVLFVDSTRRIVVHPFPIGRNIGLFVLLIDVFFVGATLFIAAAGFYELFFPNAEQARLPGWLRMRDLNDLKARVVSMLILIAAVSFVDVVVDFRSGQDVLDLGIAVTLIILALTVFLRLGTKDHADETG
jgi:uncharacterized membrane protein YqhA